MAVKKKTFREKLSYLFGQATPKCMLNTFRSVWAGRRGDPNPVTPWRLQIEVTNYCNLDCIFCSRHEHDLQMGAITPDMYDAIGKLSEKVQEVALFGYGESLVSKAFFDLLPLLKSTRITFFTNGMLLDGKMFERIAGLTKNRLAYIVFSIDGGTAETFERIRKKAIFEKVWSNIAEVVAIRDKLPHRVNLHIEFVAMRSNVLELPLLLERAEKAGIDVVKVSHLVVWDESLRDESLYYHQELGKEAFAKAEEAAKNMRLRLELPKVMGEAEVGVPPCRMPWNYAMISYEGDVRACCFSPETMTMGSLKNNTFEEIWHSDKYQALRRSLAEGRFPPACQTCEERFRYCASPNEERTYIKLTPRKK